MATVVIGAGYGDEGKGLITDFEVRRTGATMVARFNGGAQAGHTVVDGNRRHVFGHLGAGTFAGADTYLSSNFIVNPYVLTKELGQLKLEPTIKVHPLAQVTTLYDMALNSLAELNRQERHGSCGMGINETVVRCGFEQFSIRMHQLFDLDWLAERLQDIRTKWVPMRLRQLGVLEIEEPFSTLLAREDFHSMALNLQEQTRMLKIVVPYFADKQQDVVFEGAQGLALDENLGTFPHVTRSITGLPYALLAARELGTKVIKPVYVTRCYATRHGRGPLPYEGQDFGATVHDSTNVDNPWQEALRFAPLHIPELYARVQADLERGAHVAQALGIILQPAVLAVTCLDQVNEMLTVCTGKDTFEVLTVAELPDFLTYITGISVSYLSTGPSATDVKYLS